MKDYNKAIDLNPNSEVAYTSRGKLKLSLKDYTGAIKDLQKGIRIETGNTILESICGYCDFRKHCWPKAVLHEKVTSKAKSKPMVWYNKLKNTEVKNI